MTTVHSAARQIRRIRFLLIAVLLTAAPGCAPDKPEALQLVAPRLGVDADIAAQIS